MHKDPGVHNLTSNRYTFRSDIHELSELSIVVVPQDGQHGDDALRMDEDLKLLLSCHLDLLHVLGENLLNVAAKVRQLYNALLLVCLHNTTYKESPLKKKGTIVYTTWVAISKCT